MSIVSFSFVNWILSVVIDRSLMYCLRRVLCLLDPLYLCLCRISLRQKVCDPTVCLMPLRILVGGIGQHPGALPGRDNAILSEPTSSHEKCLKTRRLGEEAFECDRRPHRRMGAGGPTTIAPAFSPATPAPAGGAGDRVFACPVRGVPSGAVLGAFWKSSSSFLRTTP
jgi:hypothetical protein